jgi:threonine/homoserine/homoserine lactone efflux protein
MHAHVLPFIAVAWLILITPGVDMALVTRNALRGGRGAAVSTALGVNLGVGLWALAAALGLAAAVQASAALFDAVRLGGALYLVVLGVWSLRAARESATADGPNGPPTPLVGLERRSAFRQGLATNLLNPKMAVLFTSLLPQFIDRHAAAFPSLLLLGAIFNALGVVWLVGFALAVARSRAVLARPRLRRLQERVTGAVLIGLGIRVALER